jgi:hypothetical protein
MKLLHLSRFSLVSLALSVLFLLSACAGVPEIQTLNKGSNEADPKTNDIPGDSSSSQQREISFTQPPSTVAARPLDLLFVIDTSGSMGDERAAVVEGMQNFIEALPLGTDYRIGVLLGHAYTQNNSWGGKLYQKSTEPVVIRSVDEFGQPIAFDVIKEELRVKMSNPATESVSSGGEAFLYSLQSLLGGELRQRAVDQGFFRDDAALGIVFISDENDLCHPVAPGVYSNSSEQSFYNNFCLVNGVNQFTYDLTLQKLQSTFPGKPLVVAGLVHSGEFPMPTIGENSLGFGMIELVESPEISGILVDLADPAPDADVSRPDPDRVALGLGDIGDYARQILQNLIREKVLDDEAIDVSTLEVFVDQERVSFSYDAARRAVIIDEPGSPGSVVVIRYRVNN